MARILITSGPTRQYLDPVRYLTNASSGLMGSALAESALACGHEVVVADNGIKAVELWQNDRFDLILMDVQMPELDGFEATRKIRQMKFVVGVKDGDPG